MSASSSLSEVECLIVQAVIENTIDQLAIVGGTIQLSLPAHGGHHSIPLHQNATQKPLEELILREHKQHQKHKKGNNTDEMALRLLSSEASYVQSVLEETLEETIDSGTFMSLKESVSKSRERNTERNEIGENEKKSRDEMSRLRDATDTAKQLYDEDVQKQNMEIANLKDALLEARRASKGQEIYTEQLEAVREQESTRAMIKRENALVTEMNRLRTEISHEQRVNMEVESWLRERHTYLTNLHAHWKRKLRDDVAQKEAELQKLQDEQASDRRALRDAKEKYDYDKEYIEVTKEKMRKAEERRALEEKRRKCAIKLQAWWRMIMVQRCLGPYRKKKKAAAGKDDKKGGKGKKK